MTRGDKLFIPGKSVILWFRVESSEYKNSDVSLIKTCQLSYMWVRPEGMWIWKENQRTARNVCHL